jgi:hypothetical protein
VSEEVHGDGSAPGIDDGEDVEVGIRPRVI